MAQLPFTNSVHIPDNVSERKLSGFFPFIAAAALLYFQKESVAQQLIHSIKYHNNRQEAIRMGSLLGTAIQQSARFDDVDLIVPVPLHWRKELKRGYNQSELIARGIASTFHRPLEIYNLVRIINTSTQTHLSSSMRGTNVYGAFKVKNVSRLENKHILLVDDVLTTGATVDACYTALSVVKNLKISVATLAVVR